MAEILARLFLDSDGLVVGFAAGAILAGMLVAPIAYEAGRRRQRAFRLKLEDLRDPTDEPGWPLNDRDVVPHWPRRHPEAP